MSYGRADMVRAVDRRALHGTAVSCPVPSRVAGHRW